MSDLKFVTRKDKKFLLLKKNKRDSINLAADPSDLLSKEGFALYIGKTPRAVAEMARAGKLPAFYMTDPLKPGVTLSYGLIDVSGTSMQLN